MSDFFDVLERDLVAAGLAQVRGASPRRRRRWPALLLTTVACLGVGAATAGGTLLALRGSVIPAPATQDVPVGQLPAAGTVRVLTLRAADPDADAAPWALRLASSTTGLVCSTVGEVRGGEFGLTGLDGRFRRVPDRLTDGCSVPRANAASLVGVRVFDAKRSADVRSVVYGVAGPTLRRAVVSAGGQLSTARIDASGAFLVALRGYPEDIGATVTMRFADGHTEKRAFGAGFGVVLDPEGANAWRVSTTSFGAANGKADPRSCASFSPAREQRDQAISPSVCGTLLQGRRFRGVFFAVRRIAPGTGGLPAFPGGRWGHFPARTAVWGTGGEDVRRVDVTGPGVTPVRTGGPNKPVFAVFGGSVDPRSLRVTVTFTNGTRRTYRGDTNLVDPPRFR